LVSLSCFEVVCSVIHDTFSENLRDDDGAGPETNANATNSIAENDDDGMVDGPTVLAHVELARSIREFTKLARELYSNMLL